MNNIPKDDSAISEEMMTDLAERVRANIVAFRKRRGLRQDDFAARCGWGRHIIARLEAGECAWSLAKLQRISQVFNIPATYFLLPLTGFEEDTSLIRFLRVLESIQEP